MQKGSILTQNLFRSLIGGGGSIRTKTFLDSKIYQFKPHIEKEDDLERNAMNILANYIAKMKILRSKWISTILTISCAQHILNAHRLGIVVIKILHATKNGLNSRTCRRLVVPLTTSWINLGNQLLQQ